jgi:hypothetical protein
MTCDPVIAQSGPRSLWPFQVTAFSMKRTERKEARRHRPEVFDPSYSAGHTSGDASESDRRPQHLDDNGRRC